MALVQICQRKEADVSEISSRLSLFPLPLFDDLKLTMTAVYENTPPAYLAAIFSTRAAMRKGDPSSFGLAKARRRGVVR